MAKLKVIVNLCHNGVVTPWEELTAEQIREAQAAMHNNMEKALSSYYTAHTDEFARL